MITYHYNGKQIDLVLNGTDSPNCPNCKRYNAMLFDHECNQPSNDYVLKCRDCGAEVVVLTIESPSDSMNASISSAYAVVQMSKRKWSVVRQQYQAGNGRNEPIQVFGYQGHDFKTENEALAFVRQMMVKSYSPSSADFGANRGTDVMK